MKSWFFALHGEIKLVMGSAVFCSPLFSCAAERLAILDMQDTCSQESIVEPPSTHRQIDHVEHQHKQQEKIDGVRQDGFEGHLFKLYKRRLHCREIGGIEQVGNQRKPARSPDIA
ncbi:hypothetical protein AGMMS50289_21180 [Betaproteobacteria bacterium]|nr:hypothetical protein AGMMS50289_21180 [Betaproteobacteria bacterium]